MTGSAPRSARRFLFIAAVFPPAGLWLLWRGQVLPLLVRIAGTLALLVYSAAYIAMVVAVLHFGFGLTYEFRGGYIPRLTFRKTQPDYEALEKSRSVRAAPLVAGVSLPTNSPWNGFRGALRDGHYREVIRTNWEVNGLQPLWRQPCGGGYASFAIAGELAFTIEQRRAHETVVAYHIETGREVWTQAWPGEFTEPLGGDGPRATPAYDHRRVYALGALGEFQCLDALSGQTLWRKNIIDENNGRDLTYGMAASPLIIESNVVVMAGGRDGKCVVAFNKVTGDRVWNALDDSAAYSSPAVVTLAGIPQLLVVTKNRAVGLQPHTGSLFWEFPWIVLHNNRNIAQPVIVGSNRVFLSAGYGTGCALIEINSTNSTWSVAEVWRNKNLKNKFTSSVLWQGHIYGLDEDILTCLDASTGQRRWKEGRYGYGQLILAGGLLVILSGNGEIAVVKPSPANPEELARFKAISGKTWNHPAMVNGRLLVRNSAEMACFDLRPR